MSVGYKSVQWSPHKRLYDAVVVACVLGFVGIFFGATMLLWPGAFSEEIVLIRATGACAIVLLHAILCIGPLARLDRRFLPILSNRRHLGVLTFLTALVHAGIVLGFYHGFGVVNPLISLLTSNTNYTSLRAFPFQILGLAALVILFLLAATSHDFWLKNLSARVWKSLHMLVYVAYALLIGHVALGALQSDRSVLAPVLMAIGVVVVSGLHIVAGVREVAADRASEPAPDDRSWIDVGTMDEIPMDRARTVCAPADGVGSGGAGGLVGERIAVFKHAGGVSAVTNVCAHQGGPLGEGKVIDGCITCPWHGWQYRPGDGCSPPPFQEKIATYPVRIRAGRVEVCTTPLPPGTPTPPAALSELGHG